MRKLLKRVFICCSRRNTYIRKIYTESSFLRTPLGLTVINIIFQRLFRLNGDVKIPVNFTSRVTAYEKINHYKDKNTLLSFAVSGGCYIQAINGITFGENVLFGPGVKIISANHDFQSIDNHLEAKEIIIGSNVWIGANAILLPEVEIANGCIIAAGAVVTRSVFEEKSIIAGNPAKIIKRL